MAEHSLPVPAGLSPTERAKTGAADRTPVGGAPPIRVGNLVDAQAQARQREKDEVTRKAKEAERAAAAQQSGITNQPGQGSRTSESTKRDIETLAGVMNASQDATKASDPEPVEEEKASSPNTSLDDFEWDKLQKEVDTSNYNNPEVRKAVEKRCSTLSIEDMIMTGYCSQTVPVIPGKWEIEYQSVKAKDDLQIKKMLFEEDGSDRYIWDKYSLMNLTLSIKAMNKYPLPDHYDANGDFNDDKFNVKLAQVLNYAMPLVGMMSVNYMWFDSRVRDLIAAETLGNG